MWEEVGKDIFTSKNDPQDLRLGDLIKHLKNRNDLPDNPENAVVILGYPDDEGIQLNGGRPGAALGPQGIRRILYKMTPSLKHAQNLPQVFDLGNLKKEGALERRHEKAREEVTEILSKGLRVLTLGGGHDYGFPDMAAFCDVTLKNGKRPFIVNFDAHLDVRPDGKGPHSGTPFYRLLKEFSGRMDFFDVGIQDWCNSREHLRWAQEHGAQIISLEEILQCGKTLEEFLSQKILSQMTRGHRLAISVDIDGFESSSAPGASQVFPVGLNATLFLNFWKMALIRYRPSLAGFYEVSPPLDQDDRTSRLAAILLHQFIHT